MRDADRETIINSLAVSMGIQDKYNTKYSSSRYDAATGTYYCEGLVLPHSSMMKILEYYKTQMERNKLLAIKDKSASEQYMRAAVAYNAIQLLQDNLENSTE